MEVACTLNTLVYDADLCVGCGMCSIVCPHGVFSPAEPIRAGSKQLQARLLHPEDCMECGACALNCLTGAIKVESGVGCATAMIYAALTGKEVSCGGSGCCGTAPATDESECCSSTTPKTGACCSSAEPKACACSTVLDSTERASGSTSEQKQSGCCGASSNQAESNSPSAYNNNANVSSC
jgi:ferredoxin